MRLLVPARISLALRKAASCPPVSADVATPTKRGKGTCASARAALQQKLLQQCARNDFTKISELLEEFDKSEHANQLGPNVTLIHEVLWSGIRAKSFGSLPPSTLKWIEDSIMQLPEPPHPTKESMIWLLAILRDDWLLLQQLQEESSREKEKIGPEVGREETLRHLALAYLQAGKKDEFRSLWTLSGTPPLDEDDQLRNAALLHQAMQRSVSKGEALPISSLQSDPAMLRWYAESLTEYQRTPIEEEPQFKTIIEPMIALLGGKIERWTEKDPRMEKLRKWRDDYEDCEMDKLTHSLLDYMEHEITVKNQGSLDDLTRLERMLARIDPMKGLRRMEVKEKQQTIVVDWLNIDAACTLHRKTQVDDINKLVKSYSL